MWVALGSVNAAMTNDKEVKERLILAASFSRSPLVPVLLCRSDPAKSTRLSFPTLNNPLAFPSSPADFIWVLIDFENKVYSKFGPTFDHFNGDREHSVRSTWIAIHVGGRNLSLFVSWF